jgi:DNA polymerase
MTKEAHYAALVSRRKAYDPKPFGLENPAWIAEGAYDSDHIGPWTRWAHDLDASVMVVGQDWGDARYFIENKGLDKAGNPTNEALASLLASIGRPVPPIPCQLAADDADRGICGVWLTNACLWLKGGGMSAPVKREWFGEHSAEFLHAQVELVEPRVVVALGSHAYDCLMAAYGVPARGGPFRLVVERRSGVRVNAQTVVVGVYHCGARIQNTVRSIDQQLNDWTRLKPLLTTTG